MHFSLGMDEFQRKPEPVITRQEIFPLISTKWRFTNDDEPAVRALLAIKGEFGYPEAIKASGLGRDTCRDRLMALVARKMVQVRYVKRAGKKGFTGGGTEAFFTVVR